MKSNAFGHRHGWAVALGGLSLGLALMLFAPRLRFVSETLLLLGGVHLVGAVVAVGSLRSLWARRPAYSEKAILRATSNGSYDFGWTPGWMNGLWMAALLELMGAVAVAVAAPAYWPLAFALLLLATGQLAGSRFLRKGLRPDHVVLPMVEVVRGDRDRILDAGAGTGRTTIALGRVLRGGKVVALDRFDAGYIVGGGRGHLEHNLEVAGLTERVEIAEGDVTALPYGDASFDGTVSAHMIDHLGPEDREKALRELRRVVRPGGRLLMLVWVPTWEMFASFNLLAFAFLTPRRRWRELVQEAGWELRDEGMINGTFFLLAERPS